jgi:hypothetical protein
MRRLIVLALLLALTGCQDDEPEAWKLPPESERVKITDRAIAAVALDHVPDDTSLRGPMNIRGDSPPGTVGAKLWYGELETRESGSLGIRIEPVVEPVECDDITNCVDLGGGLQLIWAEEQPEEDPGYVYLMMRRDGETVIVSDSETSILGDPREQELVVDFDDMVAIARDPRLRTMTGPDVVEAGENLDDWTPRDGHAGLEGLTRTPARARHSHRVSDGPSVLPHVPQGQPT